MKNLFWLWFVLAAPLCAIEPGEVLILANSKAEGSVGIAEYYAEMRGIPKEQILKLAASDKEEISRDEFNKDIWDPVRKYLAANEKIVCIVPTRGVPLKVKQQNTAKPTDAFHGYDQASVDSELMLARADELKIDAVVENPLLEREQHITPADKILVVCRLDGPTVEIARGLVEKAILAEACIGEGMSYLDTRGLTSGDGYQQRDDIMEKVEDSWKALGIGYVHDTKPDVVDLSTFKEPLHYYGWYAGGQTPAGPVRFRTGGICTHLHSFAGATVRNPAANWCGPLLSWNATCTYGTTYEPYTTGFPYEHIFWARLSQGYCFGEAGMLANHLLSWQSVFVGDPLYTPYPEGWKDNRAKRRAALATLLAASDKAEGPPSIDADEPTKLLLGTCAKLLKQRAASILAALKGTPAEAMKQLNDLTFLVRDFELGPGISILLEPLNRELKQQLEEIKLTLKADLRNTAQLDAALINWKGLQIEQALLEFKQEITDAQEKEAAALVKTAQGKHKGKRYLDCWQLCAQALRFKYAPSAKTAKALQDEILADAKAKDKLTESANKALKQLREAAQKDFDRKKYDKAELALRPAIDDYPECDEKAKSTELLKKIDEALQDPKNKPKGK